MEIAALVVGLARMGYRGPISETCLSSLVAHARDHGVAEVLAWVQADRGLLLAPSWQFWWPRLGHLQPFRKGDCMPYLNHVTLMGHLTQDPELRFTPKGTPVTSLRIGINPRVGEGQEKRSEFYDCDVFGGWAENLCKTAKKGSLVVLEGRLRHEQWIDGPTNKPRSKVKIVAFEAVHVEAQYAGDKPAFSREAGDEGDAS